MTNAPTSPRSRRLGWVLGLTSTAYFMVVLDSYCMASPVTGGHGFRVSDERSWPRRTTRAEKSAAENLARVIFELLPM